MALAFLLAVPAALPAAADCDPASIAQGSYDRESGVFTRGTTTRDLDYRIDCAESATDDDASVTLAIDANRLPAGRQADSLFVMRLTGGARVNEENAGGFRYVVIPSAAIETTAARWDGHGLRLRASSGNEHMWVESRATVTTRGAASYGIYAESRGSGTATATNYGTIVNNGGVHEESNAGAPWQSLGAYASNLHERGDARAVNQADGTIRMTEAGGSGLAAYTHGTGEAIAENRGAITVTGDAYEVTNRGNTQYLGQLRESAGVVAWSGGTGRALAVNHAGGRIETTGDGSPGLRADSYTCEGGEARVENRGTVVTRGDRVTAATSRRRAPGCGGTTSITGTGDTSTIRSRRLSILSIGLYAWSNSDVANAVNDTGGVTETHGPNAHAIFAGSDVRAAQAVNRGNVRTNTVTAAEGELPGYRGAFGIYAYSTAANALAENDATGQVATKGPWAFGLIAETQNDGSRTSAQARAVNRGRVTTEGRQAEGVLAIAHRGGTEANPNLATALNAAGARIETTGDETGGLAAAIVVGAGGTSFGTARAENTGTIVASGRAGVWDDNEPENKDAGVWAGFFNFTDEAITDTGDATVLNSGDVTVTGAGMTGLRALTYGAGTATVEMTGGTVTASAADESGIGIWAGTGATGTARVTVDGGRVRAPLAARLEGGTTRLTLANGAFLEGDVSFGAGADTLETAGYIGGDVSFGAGEDTLLFDVRDGVASIEGTITGLEDMIKRGTGTARVHDATFAGSSLAVDRGSLNVRGHLDLGADGTVTVEDVGRLTIEIGDIAADSADHGRVTAGGGVTLKGAAPGVFAVHAPGRNAAERTATELVMQSRGVKPFSAGTRLTTSSGVAPTLQTTDDETGEAKTVGTLETTTETGTTATLNPDEDLATAPKSIPEESPTAEETEEPAPAAKDDDNEKTALAIGGGAVFALALFDFFDLFDVMFGDEAPVAGGFAAWAPATERAGEDGIVWWSQAMTGDAPVPASALHGLRMGATARLGDGFHLGFSGMPQLAAGLDDSAFDGHRYALRGGWESDALFANADFSRGDYRAQTTFANLDGLGSLSGAFGLRHERARAEMGTRLGLGGLRLDPSLSLFTGSLDQAAYTATSAALRSEIPALSQRYDGWKARVALAPADWLEADTLRWRPELNLATARIATDGPEGLRVRQADRAGVLRFSTPATAQGLPRTIHAAGAAVNLARAGDWTLRSGYTALVVDGEPVHAAAARFRLRF